PTYDPVGRRGGLLVTVDGSGRPGEPYPLAAELLEPLGWTFEDGVARYTRIYRAPSGAWITAFAPIADTRGRTAAVLSLDYSVDLYFARLREPDSPSCAAAAAGGFRGLLLRRLC